MQVMLYKMSDFSGALKVNNFSLPKSNDLFNSKITQSFKKRVQEILKES